GLVRAVPRPAGLHRLHVGGHLGPRRMTLARADGLRCRLAADAHDRFARFENLECQAVALAGDEETKRAARRVLARHEGRYPGRELPATGSGSEILALRQRRRDDGVEQFAVGPEAAPGRLWFRRMLRQGRLVSA